ncbi:3-oxoacyl-[acyl-carrier-protein] reductase [Candidatus Riesia pediculischaeffi]|uniref:3-oxoacyl-[acyl-carrier-protein] reductase n=1 Tax=Candidatus Riesia pediculischaeffi TaxID=428411 RepID=A0A1V0HKI7_9ENTR|nr:3-oxoacyl-[acyl-carrier-protein] reductase [Candidatus Riesia pediculischaeffi]ARC53252.1 3-ketoacyl-ACP reductase [Candidatus Riesia pediculischaeffi]
MNLYGKLALVTGASRGIGVAISKLLMRSGATVVGTSTNSIGAKKIDDYVKNGGKGYVMDVQDEKSVLNCFDKIKKDFGGIDILVNNVGIVRDNLLVRMSRKDWEDVIHVNLVSIFNIIKTIIRSMIKKKYGRIISIGSVVGFRGNIGQTNYSSSKSGLIGFSKSLAMEVAKYGITVNVVSPGFINAGMTKNLNENRKKEILSYIPMKRFGTSDEVASVVLFLASDYASYITGETIHVNGGITMI